MINKRLIIRYGVVVAVVLGSGRLAAQSVLIRDANLIDGSGRAPQAHMDLLIKGDSIAAIGKGLSASGAKVVDVKGKTVMPALISTHSHVGTLKGVTTDGANYTRENLERQLGQYAEYGVGAILAMGTDRPLIFGGFRDSSQAGLMPGARLYSAGYGFGVPDGAPPVSFGMDRVFRPADAVEAGQEVESVAGLHPTVVKIWVDDFGRKYPKMKPEIYGAIIRKAHAAGLRVASHLYYLEDARRLVDSGVDIIAHSIRDEEIDDALLKVMKKKGVVYIPTLSLDEYAYIYARKPEWIDDQFFKSSLEPGVYEMITSKDYQDKLKASPDYERNRKGFEMAMRNLKKIYDAGILVSMGTDSGATPLRAQGFSEHLELELMVEAGLTPLQAITVATRNSAKVLRADRYGMLAKGKSADLIIVDGDPSKHIRDTRKIVTVWLRGREVSRGPVKR